VDFQAFIIEGIEHHFFRTPQWERELGQNRSCRWNELEGGIVPSRHAARNALQRIDALNTNRCDGASARRSQNDNFSNVVHHIARARRFLLRNFSVSL